MPDDQARRGEARHKNSYRRVMPRAWPDPIPQPGPGRTYAHGLPAGVDSTDQASKPIPPTERGSPLKATLHTTVNASGVAR